MANDRSQMTNWTVASAVRAGSKCNNLSSVICHLSYGTSLRRVLASPADFQDRAGDDDLIFGLSGLQRDGSPNTAAGSGDD
jgi:hypothetical protein